MAIYVDLPPPRHNNSIRLLQLSDSHLLIDKNKTFAGILPFVSLQRVLDQTLQQTPFDCIISTGDIAQEPSKETYQAYLSEVEKLNTPHYWIKGNHDYGDHFPSQVTGDQPNVIVVGQWCFILLNSQVNDKVHGNISKENLDFLAQYLHEYKNYHVLIALHHNTFAVGCDWLDQHGLLNTDEFLACITAHGNVKLVISGHVHQEYTHEYKNIQFLSCPSTCVQFKPLSKEFCLDTLTPGYRTFELFPDGRFSTQIFRLAENIGEIDLTLCEY